MRTLLPLLVLACCSLSACVSVKTGPSRVVPVPDSGVVGVLFLTDDNPTHVHVGTTIFNNEEKPLRQDWGYATHVMRVIRNELKEGFTARKIQRTSAFDTDERTVRTGWDDFPIRDNIKFELERLSEKEGLAAIILIEPVSYQIEYGTPVSAKGYGVFTRCFAKACRVGYLDHVFANIAVFPAGRTYDGVGDFYEKDLTVKIDYGDNAKDLDNVDLSSVKDKVLFAIEQDIIRALQQATMRSSN